MPDFHGFASATLQNSKIRVEYLTQAGPRIVRIFLAGSDENLFGEFPAVTVGDGQHPYRLLGGHRVWAAPERPEITYARDNIGLAVKATGNSVDMRWMPKGEGVGKGLSIRLAEERPEIEMVHEITNHFEQPMLLAAWGITVLPLGGRAYLEANTRSGVHMWPYSPRDDPRLKIQGKLVEIKGQTGLPPLKVGTFSHKGLCAYLGNGVLMVKQSEPPKGIYPDENCNTEVYCDDRYLEMETLGPLVNLASGESTAFAENWTFFSGDEAEQKLATLFSLAETAR